LEKAIYEFAERISLSSTLKINCDIHLLNERLNSTLESIIYRLIQEMTTNIIKHAKATNVTLQLIEHDNELTVLVEDDGVGFDTEQVGENGIGLQNLKTRVAFLKGAIHFDSSIGKGTTITIDVPLV
jgi:signal transduction histidine kinase